MDGQLRRQKGLHQMIQRRTVARKRRLHLHALCEDDGVMVAKRPRDEDRIPIVKISGGDLTVRCAIAKARGIDVKAALPFDDLCITGHDRDARLLRRLCHGADDRLQYIGGKSRLEDEARRQIEGPCPHRGQIIHRPTDGEPSDVAPRKEERRDDKAVRRHDRHAGEGRQHRTVFHTV